MSRTSRETAFGSTSRTAGRRGRRGPAERARSVQREPLAGPSEMAAARRLRARRRDDRRRPRGRNLLRLVVHPLSLGQRRARGKGIGRELMAQPRAGRSSAAATPPGSTRLASRRRASIASSATRRSANSTIRRTSSASSSGSSLDEARVRAQSAWRRRKIQADRNENQARRNKIQAQRNEIQIGRNKIKITY